MKLAKPLYITRKYKRLCLPKVVFYTDSSRNDQNDDESSNRDNQNHNNYNYNDDDHDTFAVTMESANLTLTAIQHFLRKCSFTNIYYRYIVVCHYHQD